MSSPKAKVRNLSREAQQQLQAERLHLGYEVEGAAKTLKRHARVSLARESAIRPKDVRFWSKSLRDLGCKAVTSIEAAESLALIWGSIEDCIKVSDTRVKMAATQMGIKFMSLWNDMLKQCADMAAMEEGPGRGSGSAPVTVEKAIMIINSTTGKDGSGSYLPDNKDDSGLSVSDFDYLDQEVLEPHENTSM